MNVMQESTSPDSLEVLHLPPLTEEEIAFIRQHGSRRHYPKNTILITEGDRGDQMYFILKGRVKAYTDDDGGKSVILNIQGPGEYFGELAVIDDCPRSCSVMTLEASDLVIVTREVFEACLLERPEIALRFFSALTRRVRDLTHIVKSLALEDVYGRIIRVLEKLSSESADGQRLTVRLTQQEIADMVGASRVMVGKILKDLTTGGFIRLEKDRHYVILKPPPRHW